MTRVKALAGCLCASLLCAAVFAGTAAADGVTVSEQVSPSDSLWHIDVTVNFSVTGNGANASNTGAGTVRVTLPGFDPNAAPAFDQSKPAEPYGYTCTVVTGAYGAAGTGFECSNQGQSGAGGTSFPTDVTLHLLASACYTFPADGSPQPAIADVWAAPAGSQTPDATFKLLLAGACPAASPEEEPVTPEPAKCVVPQLRRLTLAAAVSKLAKAHCRLGKVKRIFSPRVKKGRVISQNRHATLELANGSRVNLIVSKGPPKRR